MGTSFTLVLFRAYSDKKVVFVSVTETRNLNAKLIFFLLIRTFT